MAIVSVKDVLGADCNDYSHPGHIRIDENGFNQDVVLSIETDATTTLASAILSLNDLCDLIETLQDTLNTQIVRNSPRITFTHPNKEMLRNQVGAFLIEFLMDYTKIGVGDGELVSLIENKVDEFTAILEGKRAWF